jgi:hypothetical protein
MASSTAVWLSEIELREAEPGISGLPGHLALLRQPDLTCASAEGIVSRRATRMRGVRCC